MPIAAGAPCSSATALCAISGYALDQDAVQQLAELQGKLLAHAVSGQTRRRNRAVRCTRSGEEMARKAAENPLLEPFPITKTDCPSLNGLLDRLMQQKAFCDRSADFCHGDRFEGNPHMAGMDGFFAARFKRRA